MEEQEMIMRQHLGEQAVGGFDALICHLVEQHPSLTLAAPHPPQPADAVRAHALAHRTPAEGDHWLPDHERRRCIDVRAQHLAVMAGGPVADLIAHLIGVHGIDRTAEELARIVSAWDGLRTLHLIHVQVHL